MKAIFISYGQSLGQPVEELLDRSGIRGFTRWTETQGRGTEQGEPHYGTHAWPSKNASILTIVTDEQAEKLLDLLHKLNKEGEEQGLRAFVWNIEQTM